MKHFYRVLHTVTARCKRAKKLLLLFDFDGTLAPIVVKPGMAKMNADWHARLARLQRQSNITIGIVTGRTMSSIRARVKIPGIIYAAVHGCEIARGRRLLHAVGKENQKPLKQLARELRVALRGIKGAQVEYKDFSLAVHYRRATPASRLTIKRRTRAVVAPWLAAYSWQLTPGKMFLEVCPKLWHKGYSVNWIWKHLAQDALPCYIGDDTTDEDAFRAIKSRGVTIRIGKKKNSAAQYYVRNIDELIPWFETM